MSALKLLLAGPPRVGKSTVLAKVSDLLRARGLKVAGFVTEELRNEGERVGFRVRALSGEQAILAHVDYSGPTRVGRYGVDLDALERITLPTMDSRDSVLLIDELGRMELASRRFRDSAAAAFATAGCVVATVHVYPHPFTDELKARSDVSTLTVTADNRATLAAEVADRIWSECTGAARVAN